MTHERKWGVYILCFTLAPVSVLGHRTVRTSWNIESWLQKYRTRALKYRTRESLLSRITSDGYDHVLQIVQRWEGLDRLAAIRRYRIVVNLRPNYYCPHCSQWIGREGRPVGPADGVAYRTPRYQVERRRKWYAARKARDRAGLPPGKVGRPRVRPLAGQIRVDSSNEAKGEETVDANIPPKVVNFRG